MDSSGLASAGTAAGGVVERMELGRDWAVRGAQALWRCLQLVAPAAVGSVVVIMTGVVPLVTLGTNSEYLSTSELIFCLLVLAAAGPLTFWVLRRSAALSRRRADNWCGVRIPVQYTAVPALERDHRGHWWTGHSYFRQHTVARVFQWLGWARRDPATRREVIWLMVNPLVTGVLALPPLGLVLGGFVAVLTAWADSGAYGVGLMWAPSLLVSFLIGGAIAAVGLGIAPRAVRAHTDIARRVLDPDGVVSNVRLTQRVEELTTTRADAVGSQAAELRRIERDLHDGAQARLVAIGMTLGTIEHLMETDPPAARQLLGEARQASVKALQELRDLVRGIHPPVLAERGLGDAVRLLAMDSALPTEVFVSLPSRPESSVETAAYFCVCELLTNVAKHSEAKQVWVDILFRADRLRISVTDNGRGGADPSRGSGLRGIERRLGTFDGTLTLSSPPGGPTTVTLELPCVLSSQRTSTSSGKA